MRKLLFFALLAALVLPSRVPAQSGTPHGNFGKWNASTSTVQGYQVFRCLGTCTLTSTGWTAVSAVIPGLSFLDPAAGLTINTTYSYAVLAIDANGNQSSFSNISTVSVLTFPTNPGAPTGCSFAVQ